MDGAGKWSISERKMVRAILGAKRRVIASSASSADSIASAASKSSDEQELEPWPEFLKRTAKIVDVQLQKANLEDWGTLWRKRQWRWAGKLIQQSRHKWSLKALQWEPVVDCTNGARRSRARPRKRWDDDMKSFLTSRNMDCAWQVVAASSTQWGALEAEYLQYWS